MKFLVPIVFLALLGLVACKKENKLPKVPHISSLSVGPTTVKQCSNKDSIAITFRIQDGDADLGVEQAPGSNDIYMTSSNPAMPDFNGYLPDIPEEMKDPDKGFEGTATVIVSAAFLPIEDSLRNADTFHYEIYIKDRAGNESNRLITPDIYVVR